jgi:hypothetical protein
MRLESLSGEDKLEGLEDILQREMEFDSSSSEEESDISDYANISSSDDEVQNDLSI